MTKVSPVSAPSNGATLGELALRFGCALRGDPDIKVMRVAALQHAASDAIAFLANAKFKTFLQSTRAGAVILDQAAAEQCPVAALIVKNPYAIYARIANFLHPPPPAAAGIHPSAIVEAGAQVDPSASIGPQCFVGANARIGPRVVVGPACVVMRDSQLGADTRLIARVTLCERVIVGERCIVHPGVVIGSDGFGNANEGGVWVKVPQLGGVRVGDDVEIGANTTIDRGAIDDTVIEDGVRLDNQIQIAHNVRVGAHTAMAAQVGIAGSTTIGKRCIFAGKVGVAGQLEICDDVILMGRATVSGSISKPGSYSGALGLEETRVFRRNAARFRQLDQLAKEVRRLGGRADDTDEQS